MALDKINHHVNCNRFIPIDQEELTALELIGKVTNKTNEVVDEIVRQEKDYNGKFKELDEKKTDLYGDHKGSWQGVTDIAMADPGIAGSVIKNREDIKTVNSLLDKKVNIGTYNKEGIVENNWNKNATVNEIYGWYDSLSIPSKLNYTVLGKDQSNTYDIRLYDYKPQNFDNTIFVTCAIHGWEHYSSYVMYEVLKKLINNTELPIQYEQLRNSRILIIPIVNPWGVMADNNTGEGATRRGNSRGVDLNRNFDYNWDANGGNFGLSKGESPFSELETQYVKNVLDNYEISFFLDIHSFYKFDNRQYLFYANTEVKDMTQDFINWLNDTYGIMNIELTTTETDSCSNNYANRVRNTRACNIELMVDDSNNGDNRKWIECILNYLSIASKTFKFNTLGNYNGCKIAQREAQNNQSVVVPTSWAMLENLSFTYEATNSGIYEVTGFVCIEIVGGDNTTAFTIAPSIEQPLYYSPKSINSRAKPYVKSTIGVHYIPFSCSMYVKKGMGKATFNLEIIKEGVGTITIKRSDATYKFIPCEANYVYLGQHNKVFT